MDKVANGMIAGLAATVVLSMVMVAKAMMGLMPELNVIDLLGSMMNFSPGIGWLVHFMIGMFAWGIGFSTFCNVMPGSSTLTKGISFGIAAWVLMMLVIMPMAGTGFFGLSMGMMAPVMTMMLPATYGAVLGFVFGRLASAKSAPVTKGTDFA